MSKEHYDLIKMANRFVDDTLKYDFRPRQYFTLINGRLERTRIKEF